MIFKPHLHLSFSKTKNCKEAVHKHVSGVPHKDFNDVLICYQHLKCRIFHIKTQIIIVVEK